MECGFIRGMGDCQASFIGRVLICLGPLFSWSKIVDDIWWGPDQSEEWHNLHFLGATWVWNVKFGARGL